jgi:hypothetical protein
MLPYEKEIDFLLSENSPMLQIGYILEKILFNEGFNFTNMFIMSKGGEGIVKTNCSSLLPYHWRNTRDIADPRIIKINEYE